MTFLEPYHPPRGGPIPDKPDEHDPDTIPVPIEESDGAGWETASSSASHDTKNPYLERISTEGTQKPDAVRTEKAANAKPVPSKPLNEKPLKTTQRRTTQNGGENKTDGSTIPNEKRTCE